MRPNVFDKKFAADFRRIYQNNDTGIKQDTIAEAQNQLDEITEMTKKATAKQINNIAEGEKLLASTQ